MAGTGDVTRLLGELSRGDESALARLMPLVYGELHRLAQECFRGESPDNTLQPTALVHEACLRLVRANCKDFENHCQSLGEAMAVDDEGDVDTIALDEALTKLERADPELCRVVELRYFGGLSVRES